MYPKLIDLKNFRIQRWINSFFSFLQNIVLSLFIRSMSNAFTDLKKILAEKIPKEQERVAAFRKKYGTTKVGDVTVNMVILVCCAIPTISFVFLVKHPMMNRLSNVTAMLLPERNVTWQKWYINRLRHVENTIRINFCNVHRWTIRTVHINKFVGSRNNSTRLTIVIFVSLSQWFSGGNRILCV